MRVDSDMLRDLNEQIGFLESSLRSADQQVLLNISKNLLEELGATTNYLSETINDRLEKL